MLECIHGGRAQISSCIHSIRSLGRAKTVSTRQSTAATTRFTHLFLEYLDILVFFNSKISCVVVSLIKPAMNLIVDRQISDFLNALSCFVFRRMTSCRSQSACFLHIFKCGLRWDVHPQARCDWKKVRL